jgi:hypothetical protein
MVCYFLHFWVCLQPSRVPIEIASFNHTHETTHEPLNEFSQNLFVGSIIKFDDIPVFIKSGHCTWRPMYGAARIISITNYQGKKMFQSYVERNETVILHQVHFFHVSYSFWDSLTKRMLCVHFQTSVFTSLPNTPEDLPKSFILHNN